MELHYSYEKKVLANGLGVACVTLPHLHSTEVAFYIRCGPRFETKKSNGLSHLLEHLLFRGTRTHPSSVSLNHQFEILGDGLNASTFREFTCYWSRIDSKKLESCFELYSQLWTEPLLADLEIEKKIVFEEILEDLAQDGTLVDLDLLSKQLIWPGHPMGFNILGTTKNLKNFKEKDIWYHFLNFYRASNMILSVVGPHGSQVCFDLAEKWFSHIPEGEKVSAKRLVKFPKKPPWRWYQRKSPQVDLQITFRGFPEAHPDLFILTLIQRLLDDGMSSRLQHEVCEKRGLAYDLSANLDCFSEIGLFDITISCSPKKTTETLRVIAETLHKLRAILVPETEFQRVRMRCHLDALFALDNPRQMSILFAETDLFLKPLRPEEILAKIQAITPDDVRRVSQFVFDPAYTQLVALGPRKVSGLTQLRREFSAALVG